MNETSGIRTPDNLIKRKVVKDKKNIDWWIKKMENMDKSVSDVRTRKWLVTINNPIEKGYTHDIICDKLNNMSKVMYYCLSDETGAQGTFHTHIFIAFANACRFSTMKNAFDGAHFDVARGSCIQNRDYVFKEGKWLEDEKGETNDRDSHIEWGEMPVERQGKRNDLDDLYDMIKSGMTNIEIYDSNPSYILQSDRIDKVRQEYLYEKFRYVDRDNIEVIYVYGLSGSGKTTSVMNSEPRKNIYRVTDYSYPFDSYCGENVIVFDEFRSQFNISYMLDLLDKFPVQLKSRYTNKCACYNKVYMISNIPLEKQYEYVKRDELESYNAFLRRVHKIRVYDTNGMTEFTNAQYFEHKKLLDSSLVGNPFAQEQMKALKVVTHAELVEGSKEYYEQMMLEFGSSQKK